MELGFYLVDAELLRFSNIYEGVLVLSFSSLQRFCFVRKGCGLFP